MRLLAIHLFPVKSMAGHQVGTWLLTARGLVGDRAWALADGDGKLGSGKDTRRFRRRDPLFGWAARLAGPDAEPEVAWLGGEAEAADGPTWRPAADAQVATLLTQQCGERVLLRREKDPGLPDSFMDGGAISLVGTATLADLGLRLGAGGPVDPRHLRANLIVETDEPYVEDSWVGRELRIGAATCAVTERVARCRTVDLAQADLPAAPGLLKATGAREACAAVYLTPLAASSVAVGDDVTPPSADAPRP